MAAEVEETPIGPRDFDPYRDEIRDCHCAEFCLPLAYVTSKNSGTYAHTGEGQRENEERARALLAALVAGAHQRVEFREFVAQAKAEKARRLAEAGTEAERAVIERGYVSFKMSDFYATGMGLGIGGRV